MKKLLEVLKNLGVSEPTIASLSKEGITDAEIDALAPTISTENRKKWEGVLAGDTTFTQQFSNAGHSAGSAKAYRELKKSFAGVLKLALEENSEDFTDNAKFIKAVEKLMADKTKAPEDVQKAVELAKAELEKSYNEKIQGQLAAQEQRFWAEKTQLSQNFVLKTTLLSEIAGKKLKLPADKVAKLLEMDLNEKYKLEFDESNQIKTVLGKDGQPIHNEKKDGFLGFGDILGGLIKDYLEPENQTPPPPAGGLIQTTLTSTNNNPSSAKTAAYLAQLQRNGNLVQ